MTIESRRQALNRLDRLASWMDDRFRIPGTRITFGFDALLGLVPGVGDTATAASAVYIVGQARALGVPKRMIAKMVLNVLVDLAVGTIPLVGDLFDIGFKANRRNVEMLRRYFSESADATAAKGAVHPPGAGR